MYNNLIDLNKMAQSVYNTVMDLQKSAVDMVGIDAIWCRSLPHTNSEDVVIQEYTLSNVECPKNIRVIFDKTDYQAGSYNVDLWGVSFEAPLEISIHIQTWESIYGKNTAPQKGDIIYIPMLHRLMEVSSSTIVYTMNTLPSSYKCSLRKYQRSASRKENQEVHISIDELTNAQDLLFGEEISNEVADAVIERETSYKNTSYVDPIKDCDLNAVITEQIYGTNGNLIANGYYSFNTASKQLSYGNIDCEYNGDKHWIFSSWVRLNHNKDLYNKPSSTILNIRIIKVLSRTKDSFVFHINIEQKHELEVGDQVELYRGSLLNFSGIIGKDEVLNIYTLSIPAVEVYEGNKKANKWWETITQGWKIKKEFNNLEKSNVNKVTFISGYNGIDKIIDFSYSNNIISILFNNYNKNIKLPISISDNEWHYILIDISETNVQIIINTVRKEITAESKYKDECIFNKEYKISNKIKPFNLNSFNINNQDLDIDIANIRLYESDEKMGVKYKVDMYSSLTQNASKLILIDNPISSNKQNFISNIR